MSNTTEGLNLHLLPTIEGEFQVAREAPKQSRDGSELNFISLDVQTPEPVAFPRNDGEEPRSSKQRFRISCSRERFGEAFEELRNAPLGSTVRIRARLSSRRATPRSSDYPEYLATLEATDAEVLTIQTRKDQDPA